MQRFNDARDWFFEKRYGLFIHWGLYALNGWHEQEQWRRPLPRASYIALAEQFNPLQFDPDAWIDLAEEAGMQYICLTAKHHDGFCLWDTAYTDYQIMNTPYKRDIIAMMAEACARRGMPFEIYYSCVDWHHPNYPNEGRHHELPGPEQGDVPDMDKYMRFVRNQVRELCTRYGKIHGWFWDMNVPKHVDASLNAMIRELQPQCVINDRGYDEGDYGTPERDYDSDKLNGLRCFDKPTEACQSVGMTSWGYRVQEDYYSSHYLTQSIGRALAMGGNYLLNVGPHADGTIGAEEQRILREVGAWYRKVQTAYVEGLPAPEAVTNEDVLITVDKERKCLYAHLIQPPKGSAIVLEGLSAAPVRAQLLNTGQELQIACGQGTRHWQQGAELRLRGLPVELIASEMPVIRLEYTVLPELAPHRAHQVEDGLFR